MLVARVLGRSVFVKGDSWESIYEKLGSQFERRYKKEVGDVSKYRTEVDEVMRVLTVNYGGY